MSDPEDPGGARRSVEVADEQSRPVDAGALARFASRALDAAGVPATHSLSLAFVDRARITELKEQFFGERRATDVLSFPMDPLDAPGPAVLGDVVVCIEVAERQARGLGIPVQEEIEHLIVHGIVHLAGRDHIRPEDERAMAADEERILASVRAVAS